MADESKKYLINVESNLNKYAEEAAAAKKKVDELYIANLKLQASDKATAAEKEVGLAALKNANDEYRKATSLVKTQVAANSSEQGSRKQLSESLKLQMQQLGKLGNAYVINAKGVRELNPLYIEQRKRIAETKQAIIDYDLALNDGRSNVGRYGESMKSAMGEMNMMPGVMGTAASSVNRLSMAFKAMLANPIVLVITLIVGAIAALVKGFKNSQPLMDAFNKISAAIGATFKVLLDRVSNFTEFLGSIFNKELRDSRKAAQDLNDELIGIEDTMTEREKRQLRRANKKGLLDEIKEEAAAAYDLTKAEQELEDSEIKWIQTKANLKRQIEENLNSSKDENLSNKEKLKNLDAAVEAQKLLTSKEIEFAKERARISNERTHQGLSSREELRANEEAQAAASEAEAMGLKETKRILSERFSLINKLSQEEKRVNKEKNDAIIKSREEMDKALQEEKRVNKEKNAAIIKSREEMDKALQELDDMSFANFEQLNKKKNDEAEKSIEDYINHEEQRLAINEANKKEILLSGLKSNYEIKQTQLALDRDAELNAARMTGASTLLIKQKYASYELILAKETEEAKLGIISSFAGALTGIFKKNTIAYKVAALAETSISTYAGAQKAFTANAAIPPSPAFGILAAASAVAFGLKNVQEIMKVSPDAPSMPTAITSSPAAQRTFAQPVSPNILNTPQLSQSQLNALPAQGLTAAEIAKEIAKLPAPIVTVEDFDYVNNAKKKVEVRAAI